MKVETQIKVNLFYRKPFAESFSIEGIFNMLSLSYPQFIKSEIKTLPYYSKGFFPRIKNVLWASRHQNQINHITGDVHFICLLMKKGKTILTIHDLEMLFRYKGISKWIIWFFWFYLPSKRVKYITVISEFTKKELLRMVPSINPSIVKVIPDCYISEMEYCPKVFNSDSPVILQVGTRHNKNVPNLLKAIQGIKCKLILLGSLSESLKKQLIDLEIDYENYFNLPSNEVEGLYKKCDMLVFASTYEGFGLPILEAQAVGRPVITSNVASMPEVGGNSVIYVNPFDSDSIRSGILEVINNADLRRQLIEDGLENIKRFKPEKIVLEYTKLYNEI